MTPFHTEPRFTLYVGNSLDVMPTLPPSSVDSIVSDPPYGLAFMGKEWDHGVPGVAFWSEALRVAKPGAHLLAFGGTRTYHRLACAIEDAGWEIRDCIMWVYGSGFPKSLDVSKAIDKYDAIEEQRARRLRFTEWVRSTGVTAKQIDDATDTQMGGHYTTQTTQPAVMTREHLEACRHLLGEIPEWVEREADVRSIESQNFAARAVIGTRIDHDAAKSSIACARSAQGLDKTPRRMIDVTAPATDAAREWNGWGTALKPAWEPIILARKPLEGTVADNVLKYGTGAVNVDGCRIDGVPPIVPQPRFSRNMVAGFGASEGRNGTMSYATGRWPANVIHDGSQETTQNMGDAARYFYTAKASNEDRDAGGVRNVHPTVKPTDLMRYLVRLVTRPGGVVLDPFMGSGSTGRGALLEGCRFVGIDLSDEYATIARERIAACAAEPSLFDAVS